MSEWQPIETAPKDGTWFFAFYPTVAFEDRYQVCRWWRFQDRFTDSADHMEFDDPTHWMPLPPPPNPPQ